MKINLILDTIRGAALTVGAFLGAFLGGMDGLLIALIWFVVIDYVTGVIAAAVTKTLNSATGFKGIARKIVIFLIVGMAATVDRLVIGSGSAIRSAMVLFYIANEGISILENSSRLGVPFPAKIKEIFEKMKEENK